MQYNYTRVAHAITRDAITLVKVMPSKIMWSAHEAHAITHDAITPRSSCDHT